MTMGSVVACPTRREISADAVRQAALCIADCRSVAALRDALFGYADALIGGVAMGLYLFDRRDELRYISSRLAPQGFLDQYEREYRRADPMLDCIVSQKRTVDGFRFHGAAQWRHSVNYDLLHEWGFHHNMGGALVVNAHTAGVVFVATAHETDPFADFQVNHLNLMCRAGSLALTAMRERERLRCELSEAATDDPSDPWAVDRDWSGHHAGLDDDRPMDRLPARSREVAMLLCRGQRNKAIAHELGISVYTVKEHVQNLCRRFGALNRTDLVHRLLISS
jgi:DNA-binding CsgD family transcriptional regulator